MITIQRYSLEIKEEQSIAIQGRILSVAYEGEQIVLYAIHNDEENMRRVAVWIFGTGHEMNVPRERFLGTVSEAREAGGELMWHVFVSQREKAS